MSDQPPEGELPESGSQMIEPVEETAAGDGAQPAAGAALERELAEARDQAAEYLDGWRRAQADLANQRRRHERERQELEAQANARLVRQLLPIVDDFDRALEGVPGEAADEQWTEGVRLIARKLHQLLERERVAPIAVQPGDTFDPNIHEAVLYEPAEGFEPGQVVAELQRGYRLGDRVLRPAQVKVAS